MKTFIKKTINASIRFIINFSNTTRIGRHVETLIINSAMERCVEVCHEGV